MDEVNAYISNGSSNVMQSDGQTLKYNANENNKQIEDEAKSKRTFDHDEAGVTKEKRSTIRNESRDPKLALSELIDRCKVSLLPTLNNQI